MSDVEFNDRDISSKSEFRGTGNGNGKKSGFLIRLVIKTGLAKDGKSANIVLFIFALIVFAISIVLFTQNTSPKGETVYREDIPIEFYESLPQELKDTFSSRNE